MNNGIDYWDKTCEGFFDLQDQEDLVTDSEEIGMHAGLLLSRKAVQAIEAHALEFTQTPLFLYYSPALVHTPFPEHNPAPFGGRCSKPADHSYEGIKDVVSYCELMLMLDDSIANVSCAIERVGWASNTVMIVMSDNGGGKYVPGSTSPLRGAKGELFNGGVLGRAIIHSQLLPASSRGSVFGGLSHLTDWLPTLMRVATNGTWSRKFNDDAIDGVDLWDALAKCTPIAKSHDSPRSDVLININNKTGEGALVRRRVSL